MRILFLSHYYAPEVNAPASRTREHCKAWAAAGHDVTVVTCAPNHPQGVVYPGYRNLIWQRETIDDVRIIRLWTYLAANEGFLRRTLNYASFFVAVALATPFLPRADVIASTSPQFFCGLAGRLVSLWQNRPWLLEIRDLWPESIAAVGAMRKGRAYRALEALEAYAYRKADAIVVVAESFVPHIAALSDPRKIHVIKNGVDFSHFRRDGADSSMRARCGFQDRLVAAYVGTHGMAHGLDALLDAAKLLQNDPRIGFLMVGDGAERARLEARAREEKIDNLRILGQLPKCEMPAVWGASDVSLVLLKKSDAFTKVLPSKLFEALAMGCPVVLGVEGEARALLETAQGGIAIAPENAENLASAVQRLAEDAALREQLATSGAEYVRAHHDRAVLARRYLALLGALALSRRTFIERAKALAEFLRYIPPSRLARRLQLTLRRRAEDLFSTPLAAPLLRLSATPPASPLAASGVAGVARDGAALRFAFLGVAARFNFAEARDKAPRDQLWRMHLHYMDDLARVDDALFGDLVDGWLDSFDPPRRGDRRDAWNAYALSLRVANWMQQLARRDVAPSLRERMARSLARQIAYLERHLETDIGGNHLIKNVKALLWASAFFEGEAARRWRALGLSLLARELDAQILADGAHYERSPSYQCQIFADLLDCRAALGGDPLNGRLDAALKGLAQAVADLAHPDGRVAQFNDSGLDMATPPAVALDAYQRLFGARPAPRRVFALPQAGYFGARLGGDYILVDCGRIAPDELPAHGHGDILSFELSIEGERLIVDPGVFEYVAGTRRAAARAAAAHNTLWIPGAEPAEFFGAFRCGRRPNVECVDWRETPDGFVFEGAQHGFAHLPGAPRHMRRVSFAQGEVILDDRLVGARDYAARLGFLLHPETEVAHDGAALILARGAARLRFDVDAPFEIAGAVWSPNLGEERPTRRIIVDVAYAAAGARTRLTKLAYAPSDAAEAEARGGRTAPTSTRISSPSTRSS